MYLCYNTVRVCLFFKSVFHKYSNDNNTVLVLFPFYLPQARKLYKTQNRHRKFVNVSVTS
jgi:hypothetical protein